MRVFLLGTLSAILLGLLIGAGSIVRARRGHVAATAVEAPDEVPPPSLTPAPGFRRREPLPAVGATGCNPRPGWACWRGRLRLSMQVVRGWRARRAQQGVRSVAEAVTDDGPKSVLSETLPSSPSSFDQHEADNAVDDDDDAATATADDPLPPDAGFHAFFTVRAFRTDGTIGATDSDDVADPGDSSVALHDDGTFEVHLPPGRYGLEAASTDGYVVGGRDDVNAIAGDAEDGLEVVLGPTVALAGRVLDEDGVLVPAAVSILRIGGDGSVSGTAGGDGSFRIDELRPGLFQVTAEAGENQTATGTFFAPMENVVLRVARAGAGLLLLPPGPDGRCGRAGVKVAPHAREPAPSGAPSTASVARTARWRSQYASDCQVVIDRVAPGSEWDLIVTSIDPTPISARVQFGYGSPAEPVCLRAGCTTATAALQVVPIDVDGRVMPQTATVIASPPGGPAVGSSIYQLATGLPANEGLTIEVRAGATVISRQIWLQPGVNRAVIQFPVKAQTLTDEDVVMVD